MILHASALNSSSSSYQCILLVVVVLRTSRASGKVTGIPHHTSTRWPCFSEGRVGVVNHSGQMLGVANVLLEPGTLRV
jgi:hypothetical protein